MPNTTEFVLVRNCDIEKWKLQVYVGVNGSSFGKLLHECMNGESYTQCVPYKGNEKLLKTENLYHTDHTDTLKDLKMGQIVEVYDPVYGWRKAVFIRYSGDKDVPYTALDEKGMVAAHYRACRLITDHQ